MSDETSLSQLPKAERRRVYVHVAALLVVPAAAITLLISAGTAGWVWWDNRRDAREASNANRELIDRLEEAEARELERGLAVRRALRRTDVLACREIEKLKAGFRQSAQDSFDQLDENAALLGIEVTPALRLAAAASRDRSLDRYAGRPGGCGTLPSASG